MISKESGGGAAGTSSRRPRRHHLDRRADAIAELLSGDDPERLMTTPETAALLGVSVSWLQIGRCRPTYGPPSITVTPKMVRYRRKSVLAWIEERAALAVTSAVVVVFFAFSVLPALAG